MHEGSLISIQPVNPAPRSSNSSSRARCLAFGAQFGLSRLPFPQKGNSLLAQQARSRTLVSGEKDASPRRWEEQGKDAPGVFSLAQPPFPMSPAVPWHRSRRAGAEGARRARRYLRSSTWAGPAGGAEPGMPSWTGPLLPPWGQRALAGRPSNPASPSSLPPQTSCQGQ